MKKYVVVLSIIFLAFSTSVFAKNDNDPFTRIWGEISAIWQELDDLEFSTYTKSEQKYFSESPHPSSIELFCDGQDEVLSGGMDGDPELLALANISVDTPIFNNQGRAVGWKFAGVSAEGSPIPVQVNLICLSR